MNENSGGKPEPIFLRLMEGLLLNIMAVFIVLALIGQAIWAWIVDITGSYPTK
jgi:hypothetical protein